VADEQAVVTLFENIERDFGGIDGLINNAGITKDRLLVKEGTVTLALSEQLQVVCVGRGTRRPKRRLGREGAPLGQRGGAPLFVNLAGDEMALLIKMVVDLGMN
jgi:NAD(P)-dependent dehydrogenase (short-subunit alcohol dehydrogenase family)